MDPGGDDQQFWLSGTLRVFAMEQVEFLQRLHHNASSFSLVGQRLVKDLMVNEAGQKWILRARSGWVAVPEQPAIGWWDGWAERAKGLVFFAINISSTKGLADAPKRQAIATKVLQSIGALPEDV